MNREILYRSDYFRGKGKIKKNPLSNPFGACKQQYRVSLAYSSFAQRNPDEILLISGFKRGEKRGRGKKKNTCKISPQSNRFRDSNIYIPVYIPRWYREASGFRFFSRSFQNATKWKCNRKVIPTSIPLAYMYAYPYMCARMRVCSTHVFNGPSIHIHFPFRFECIALHSDVERGATRFFLYFLIAPPSWFSAVFPPPPPFVPAGLH